MNEFYLPYILLYIYIYVAAIIMLEFVIILLVECIYFCWNDFFIFQMGLVRNGTGGRGWGKDQLGEKGENIVLFLLVKLETVEQKIKNKK